MAKQDEKAYYSRLTAEGRQHSDGKPFTDADCGELLMSIGQMIALLPRPPARLLDLGCGTGWTSEYFARAGYSVTAIDISLDMLQAAKRLRRHENLKFVVGDFESIPALSAFDAIASFGSLHHTENIAAALVSCKKALKPDGTIVLMEPGEGHAEAEESQRAKAEYGVTELSLPPAFLRSSLESAGYHSIETIPWLSIFLKPLSAPLDEKSWKYRAVASVVGRKMADFVEMHRSRSKGIAVVRARA